MNKMGIRKYYPLWSIYYRTLKMISLYSLGIIFNIGCNISSNSEVKPVKTKINKKIVFTPNNSKVQDACISFFAPNTNFGLIDYLISDTWTILGVKTTGRSLLEFNCSKIPDVNQIDSIFLTLHLIKSTEFDYMYSGNSGDNSFYVQRIVEPWSELDVTWINQPHYTKRNLVAVESIGTLSTGAIKLNVTAMIKDTVDNTYPILGFYINLQKEEVYSKIIFASSNHVDSTKHPELEVFYHD